MFVLIRQYFLNTEALQIYKKRYTPMVNFR